MKVFVANQQKDLSIGISSAKSVVKEVLCQLNCITDEVSIHFVTHEEICHLHHEFFNDITSTDCISFPIDDHEGHHLGYHVLGEVFVCPLTALRFVHREGKKGQAYEETTLYLVHGLLHLLGYNDLETKKRRSMRKAEERLMNHLISKNLLLAPQKKPRKN